MSGHDFKVFVDNYDLNGRRVYRFPVDVEYISGVPDYPAQVHVYRAPGGNAAAFLTGSLSAIGGVPLYLVQGQHLKPLKQNPEAEYGNGYTGVVWSPDGRRFAAYEAATGMGDPQPLIDMLDIYTATGELVAEVPTEIEVEDHLWPTGFLWERCAGAFPDPYGPGELSLNSWFAPPS